MAPDAVTEPAPSVGAASSPPQDVDVRSGARDLISGFAGSTSRIVQKAASILEEEIAMGIVAAKQMEEKFVDVDSVRNDPSNEVTQRFRKDAHEIVDILMDLVALATNSIGSLADRVTQIEIQSQSPTAAPSSNGIPTLKPSAPVMPGATANLRMSLENESTVTTDEFEFHASDLVDSLGQRIPASQISFTPPRISIPPKVKESVAIQVQLPEDSQPGTYAGLIQAGRVDHLRAVLVLTIERPPN